MSTEARPFEKRPFDVVVWGATGYTGQRTAEHLSRVYGYGPGAPRWALAGRDLVKLKRLRDRLAAEDPGASEQPLITADAHDPGSLDALCAQTRAVCATVGPFDLHGEPLAAACLRQKTHYADTTGEVPFVRRLIDRHHHDAGAAHLRLVPFCGIDSVPSDLGVLLLHEHARQADLGPLGPVSGFATRVKGNPSGGTLASMFNLWQKASADRALRRQLADPYGLNDEGERQGPDSGERPGVFHHAEAGQWAGPFLMAPVNTRVVRRANQVQGYPYGRDFRYAEHRAFGSGAAGWLRAQRAQVGLLGFFAGATLPPTRWLLKRLLPKPGEGPGADERAANHLWFEFYSRVQPASGPSQLLRARVGMARDTYEVTGLFAAEAALLLAQGHDDLPPHHGVLTPASGLGRPYVERLQAQSVTLEVESLPAR